MYFQSKHLLNCNQFIDKHIYLLHLFIDDENVTWIFDKKKNKWDANSHLPRLGLQIITNINMKYVFEKATNLLTTRILSTAQIFRFKTILIEARTLLPLKLNNNMDETRLLDRTNVFSSVWNQSNGSFFHPYKCEMCFVCV